MFGLHPLDIAVIAAYLVGIIAVGIWVARRVRDTDNYFVGGRRFGKLLMIGQAFGVGTHAEQPVAVAGASYFSGLSGIWYQWKYIFCTPFYWIIAPIFRRLRYITSAEYMEARYGAGMGLLFTVFSLVFFMMNQSAMLNGAAKVVSSATASKAAPEEVGRAGADESIPKAASGVAPDDAPSQGIPREHVIYGMTVIFVLYSFVGGLISSAVTDFIQSFLIIILSVMLLPAGFRALGGFHELYAALPPDRFGLSTPGDITVGVIVVLSIQSFFGIFGQPHHMAMIGTGKTDTNCRVGFTYGSFVKRFCTLGWALVGLIVAAMVAKGMVQPDPKDREFAFGLACQKLLGPGFVGLMIACVLAANMSTCSAFMVDVGALFVQNIYRRYFRPREIDAHYLWVGRIAGTVITAGAVGLTYVMPKVLSTILNSESLAAFIGLSFAAGLLWRRANRVGAVASFLVATAIFFGLTLYLNRADPAAHGELLRWRVDAFMAALTAGAVTLVVGSLLTRPEPETAWTSLQERLHLPTSAESAPEAERAGRAREAEANGEALLVLEAFQRPQAFSLRRYRIDLLGFAAASGVVLFLLGCAWAIGALGGR